MLIENKNFRYNCDIVGIDMGRNKVLDLLIYYVDKIVVVIILLVYFKIF